MKKDWFVYIVECSDGTLYTGVTTDVDRRMNQHNTGKGSKYTRTRYPVTLLVSCKTSGKSHAYKIEYFIKKLNRNQKILFVKTMAAALEIQNQPITMSLDKTKFDFEKAFKQIGIAIKKADIFKPIAPNVLKPITPK